MTLVIILSVPTLQALDRVKWRDSVLAVFNHRVCCYSVCG
jgi:hypothetical protein